MSSSDSKFTSQASALFYADESKSYDYSPSQTNNNDSSGNHPSNHASSKTSNVNAKKEEDELLTHYENLQVDDETVRNNTNNNITIDATNADQVNLHIQQQRTNRGIEARIKAAAGTSLPVANPPVFVGPGSKRQDGPVASQLQRVFALIEEKVGVVGSKSKEKLDALLEAFAEDKEQSRSEAEKVLTKFRMERAVAKDETDEADKLTSIAMNALARALNEALAVTEASAVNSLTVPAQQRANKNIANNNSNNNSSTHHHHHQNHNHSQHNHHQAPPGTKNTHHSNNNNNKKKDSIFKSGGLSTCARGLIMPYDFFNEAVEFGDTSIDTTYEHWVERGHARVSLAADEAAARGVAHTTASLSDLERTLAKKKDNGESAIFSPSQIELFDGVREDCSIALRAATVWRMLHQVQGQVGGMKVATQAFESLIPCIFSGIAVEELPHMSSLGGQVLQLLKFPSLKTKITSLRNSAEHLRKDADYFRRAMQHWAIQIWFRQLVGEKRRTGVLERVGGSFDRLSHRNAKRKAFAAWKMLATRGRIARFVLKTSRELNDAMNASRVNDAIDENEGVIQEQQEGSGGGTMMSGMRRRAAQNAQAKRQLLINDMSCLQSSEPWTLLGDSALEAVKTLTVVTSAFRVQLARQKETIERVESEREYLRDKVTLLESKLLRQIEATNVKHNEAEKLKQQLYQTQCGHNNAKSRLLQQEHIPWRAQAMSFVKDIAVLPPLRSVSDDQLMMNMKYNHEQMRLLIESEKNYNMNNNDNNSPKRGGMKGSPKNATAKRKAMSQGGGNNSDEDDHDEDGRRSAGGESSSKMSHSFRSVATNSPANSSKRPKSPLHPTAPSTPKSTSHQRLLSSSVRSTSILSPPSSPTTANRKSTAATTGGRTSPSSNNINKNFQKSSPSRRASNHTEDSSVNSIGHLSGKNHNNNALVSSNSGLAVLSPIQLDEPEDVLMRWVNTCLSDLQSLENNNQAPIALLRCSNKFSWEWSDSLLLSRLLYFLALPKFIAASSASRKKSKRNKNKTNKKKKKTKKTHNDENDEQQQQEQNNNNNEEHDEEFEEEEEEEEEYDESTDADMDATSMFGEETHSVFAPTFKGTTVAGRRSAAGIGIGGARSHRGSLYGRRNRGSGNLGATTTTQSQIGGRSTVGGMSASNYMPSVKNVQTVLDFSSSCRAMLLEGDCAIEMIPATSAAYSTMMLAGNNNNNNSSSAAANHIFSTEQPTFVQSMANITNNDQQQNQTNNNIDQNKDGSSSTKNNNNASSSSSTSFLYNITPTYSECFHDFHVAAARQKCHIICDFARELLDLGDNIGAFANNNNDMMHNHNSNNNSSSSSNIPVAVESDILSGQRSSIILLISLLYMKFAHPLSHGRRQGIEPSPNQVILKPKIVSNNNNTAETSTSNNNNISVTLGNDSTGAISRTHLLAGGLWEVTCVDNPSSLHQLCTWASLMRHSLDEHRWHVLREIIFVDSIVARDVRTRSLASLRRSAMDLSIPRRQGDLASLNNNNNNVKSNSSGRNSPTSGNNNNNTNNTITSIDGDAAFFDHCKTIFLEVIDEIRDKEIDDVINKKNNQNEEQQRKQSNPFSNYSYNNSINNRNTSVVMFGGNNHGNNNNNRKQSVVGFDESHDNNNNNNNVDDFRSIQQQNQDFLQQVAFQMVNDAAASATSPQNFVTELGKKFSLQSQSSAAESVFSNPRGQNNDSQQSQNPLAAFRDATTPPPDVAARVGGNHFITPTEQDIYRPIITHTGATPPSTTQNNDNNNGIGFTESVVVPPTSQQQQQQQQQQNNNNNNPTNRVRASSHHSTTGGDGMINLNLMQSLLNLGEQRRESITSMASRNRIDSLQSLVGFANSITVHPSSHNNNNNNNQDQTDVVVERERQLSVDDAESSLRQQQRNRIQQQQRKESLPFTSYTYPSLATTPGGGGAPNNQQNNTNAFVNQFLTGPNVLLGGTSTNNSSNNNNIHNNNDDYHNQNQNQNQEQQRKSRSKSIIDFSTFDRLVTESTVRDDLCSQLQGALPALHDLYLRRSTTEWDSGAVKGLKQATMIEIMVESEVVILSNSNNNNQQQQKPDESSIKNVGVLNSKSEFQNIILAEKQYREEKRQEEKMREQREISAATAAKLKKRQQRHQKHQDEAHINNNDSKNLNSSNFLSVDGINSNSGTTTNKNNKLASSSFLGVKRDSSELGAFSSTQKPGGGGSNLMSIVNQQPDMDYHEGAAMFDDDTNNSNKKKNSDGSSNDYTTTTKNQEYNNKNVLSGFMMRGHAQFLSFEEFIGVIARLIRVEINTDVFPQHNLITNVNNNKRNATSGTRRSSVSGSLSTAAASTNTTGAIYKSVTIQRLMNYSDSSELSKFKDQLDTLAVSERFSTFKSHLQELFESCATTQDGTPYTVAKDRYDQQQQQEMDKINNNSASLSQSLQSLTASTVRSNYLVQQRLPPLPFITLETFNKLVQESSLNITPELIRHVFDEAMRIVNFKSHASRLAVLKGAVGGKSSNNLLSASLNMAAVKQLTSARNNMFHMKFDGFIKAVALLAYTYDPLPSQAFPERLSKFIPQFCDSVRPVVLAMNRAKNVEIDRKVNARASENRNLAVASSSSSSPSSIMKKTDDGVGVGVSRAESPTTNNNNATMNNNNRDRPSTTTTAGSKGLKSFLKGGR